MTGSPAERSVDEVLQERKQKFDLAVEVIEQRMEAAGRGASDREIAALEPLWRALYEATLEHRRTTAWHSFAYVPPPEDDWDELVARLRKPSPKDEFRALLAEEPTTPAGAAGDARRTPAPIAMELIEEAVRIHEREGFGRRKLETEVPGLTDYTAGQILRWYRVGAPAGLWLDDKHRLKWGPAISPTPTGLRLPRL